jgi:hypothetical protein
MLRVERAAAPPAIAAEFARAAEAMGSPVWRILLQRFVGLGAVVALVFGAIGLLDLAFHIMHAGAWLVLVIGSAILLVPVLVISTGGELRGRKAREDTAAALRDAAGGEALRHVLDRDANHWFVEHEHGVILVCPSDARRTLHLDLSSVSGDPRWDDWYRSGRLHVARWTWWATPDGALQAGFAAEGEALPPNSFQAAAGRYDPEDGAALFEWLGSPGDGEVVPRPFAEVDAFLRARLPTTG